MRFLRRLVYLSGSLVLIGVLVLWLVVRASLPQLDGERVIAGLAAPALIVRDGMGVVTIVPTLRGRTRADVARATGFVHAQERFFQMDLMRRLAAGELAELVGDAATDHDIRQRLHRMRNVARTVLSAASASERAITESYADGVNAGLESLSARPPEYLILRASPSPWLAEDTVLVVLAMYFRLHDEHAERESRLSRLHDALPPAMYGFLNQAGTSWDAPLLGAALPSLPVPGVDVCDVRRVEHNPLARARRGARHRDALDPAFHRKRGEQRMPGPWLRGAPGMASPWSPTTCIWASRCRIPGSGCACESPRRHPRAPPSTPPV